MAKKVFFSSRRKVAKWMELYLIWGILFILSLPFFYFFGLHQQDKNIDQKPYLPASYENFQRDLLYINRAENYTHKDIISYLKKKAADTAYTMEFLKGSEYPADCRDSGARIYRFGPASSNKNLMIYLPVSGKKYLNLLTIPLMSMAAHSSIDFILYETKCNNSLPFIKGYPAYIFIEPSQYTHIGPPYRIYGIHGIGSSTAWLYWFPEIKKSLSGKINYLLKDSFFSHQNNLISAAFAENKPAFGLRIDNTNNEWYSSLKSSEIFASRMIQFSQDLKKISNKNIKKKNLAEKKIPDLQNNSFWLTPALSLSNWGKWYIGIFLFLLSFIPLINGFAIRNQSFNPLLASVKALIYSAFSFALYLLIVICISLNLESILMIPIAFGFVLVSFVIIRKRIRNSLNMQDNVISNMAILNILLIILALYQPLQYLFFFSIALSIFQLKMKSYFSFLMVVLFFVAPLVYLFGNPIYMFFSTLNSLSSFSNLFFPNNISVFFFVLLTGFFISMIDTNEKRRY